MTKDHIEALLRPYTLALSLPPAIYDQLLTYLDLLLRWNAHTNLTAIRNPEQIVTRHFGESLFAASVLLHPDDMTSSQRLADIGSGAGFPGLPIKLAFPHLRLTLIESQNKKTTFLREVLRALNLEAAEVFQGRAEAWQQKAEIVTLRAVENFPSTVATAAGLVAPDGTLCLLIGESQVSAAQAALGSAFSWHSPFLVPESTARIVLVGKYEE